MAKRRSKTTPALPPVGSRVRVGVGVGEVIATVIEHRGPLGVGGREVIRVRYRFTHSAEAVETEVPLDELTPVETSA